MSYLEELKILTEKLRDKDVELRSLYNIIKLICDSAEVMLWAKDTDNKYIFASKKLCKAVLGCSPTEAIGKTDTTIVSGFGKKDELNTFGEVCFATDEFVKKEKKPCRFLEVAKVSGEEVWLEVKKTPIMNGNLKGTVGAAFIVPKESREGFLIREDLEVLHLKELDPCGRAFKLEGI